MRIPKTRAGPRREILRQVERLDRLPLRPVSARFALAELEGLASDSDPSATLIGTARWRALADLDPGWAILEARTSDPLDPLALVAETPWWPSGGAETRSRLWRHAVAVSLAAQRLATEANDPEPSRVARAGLLHGLGLWVVAAIDPDRLARRFQELDPEARREFEIAELGVSWGELGRDVAERWGCDQLVADAAWLHGDLGRGLDVTSSDPARLVMIQEAFALAERTPWAMSPSRLSSKDRITPEPGVRLLIAEVQARCGSPFVETDATHREEQLTRSNARLRREVAALRGGQAARDRLLGALAASDPNESPEAWSERVGLALCQTPGVSVAQVGSAEIDQEQGSPSRPPTIELPLTRPTLEDLRVRIWTDSEPKTDPSILEETLPAWRAWANMIAERARLSERLTRVLHALRGRAESEEPRLRLSKLNALAEFAAGAGHELNNPLAVIVGRAQLLLVGETDPKAVRGLRAILTQAQRAHRILRDLMYVARTPEPRLRCCQPDEILKSCLRDSATEAEERGVKLVFETSGPGTRPGPTRMGYDTLLMPWSETPSKRRLEAAQFVFLAEADAKLLRWTLHDTGEGISAARGTHLFDPFYCGRAAGRGLGLGLPRASRFVEAAGGRIQWRSTPGQGTTFEVQIPLGETPKSPPVEGAAGLPALMEPRAPMPQS